MKFIVARTLWLTACVIGLLAAGIPAWAQPIQNAVFTLGTTTRDTNNNPWAYIVLQPTDPASLKLRSLAIYAKPGNAASASPYTRQSVVGLQTEPLTIDALLTRSKSLGEDLGQLEHRVDNLFAALMPSTNMTLAQKLSIVIRGSIENPQNFGSLILLGRLHPGVNLCLGFGYAQQLTNGPLTTFEVRDYDATNHTDRGVLGRITITNGVSFVLPPPGRPAYVPERGGMGQLNARFRWATPVALRQVALLSAGFDLFRVPKAVAEASGYTNSPPTTAQLLGNPATVRVNTQPIFKNRDYDDDLAAADLLADPKTFFIADDNGLAQAHPPELPVRFHNGDQFYYYVAARDLLARNGLLSPGVLVTICDRLPSDAPHLPQVVNDYVFDGVNEIQKLKVLWKPVTNPPPDKHITGYVVYRWTDPEEALQFGANPGSHRISGIIPHVVGKTNYSYIDNGVGAPSAPADYGQTFWYTVRALDDGACDGGNLSPNSSAAFGVLRDRTGPNGPGGGPVALCCLPGVAPDKSYNRPFPSGQKPDPEIAYFEIVCKRADAQIAWAEFSFAQVGAYTNYIGRFQFPANSDTIIYPLQLPMADFKAHPSQIAYCRVGTPDGQVSAQVSIYNEAGPSREAIRGFPFNAAAICRRGSTSVAGNFPCRTHNPQTGPVGSVSTNNGVDVVIQLTPGTKEFKLYRRVDFGPLSLIQEGPGDYNTVTNLVAHDNDMPANSGTICYYAQLFDEHGNASPLTPLGLCLDINLPPPTPLLSPLFALGDVVHPKMGIRWFCPSVGVQRFEVLVAVSQGNPPANLGDVVGSDTASHPYLVATDPSPSTNVLDFAVYPTPGPGLDFGPAPEFDLQVPIQLGVKYTVQIRAIGIGGAEGPGSHFETFKWAAPPPAVGPEVPWPQRPWPAIGSSVPLIAPYRLTNGIYEGIVLSVGRILRTQFVTGATNKLHPNLIPTITAPDIVGTNSDGKSLLPFAVYRYQVPNPKFPVVSGDIVQSSPYIDSIALVPGLNGNQQPYLNLADPFFIAPQNDKQGSTVPGGSLLYLLDTQPVLRGATYKYLVVRFGADGEPVEVIPTPTVDVVP
ncbi:MAG TPA: hypothetical protein VMF06_20275 [Candidatus Limnocylindria bacterium]|jgi:hypothetical protein|nr:hypothetical protein [Candidatus Limnocylindria bacterium]